jgi:hypothetical protein
MKQLCLFSIIVFAGFAACGQDYQRRPWMALENRVGLALGIGSVTYLDKNSSPLIYQTQPKNIRLFYNLESNHFLFALNFDFRTGANRPKYHPNRTLFFPEEDYKGKKENKKFPAMGSFLGSRISLGAYYKISSTQESTFKVAVGGTIMNDLFYPQGWTSAGLFNALSFSPEAMVQHRVDDHHSFQTSLRIPLVTNLTRLPHDNTVSKPGKSILKGFFDNAGWVGPAKYLAPAMSLSYNYQINSHWGAGLHYDLGWYNIQRPQTLRATSQALLANFYHQF